MSQPAAERAPLASIDVRVDPDRCQGAQRCTYLRPDVFALGADGQSRVMNAGALTDPDAAIAVAAECPNRAIRLVLDGHRVY